MTMAMAMAYIFSYTVWSSAITLLTHRTVAAFTGRRVPFSYNGNSGSVVIGNHSQRSSPLLSSVIVFSSPNDDWGLEDAGEDPRMEAMRSLLESSWDGEAMGIVPSGPEKGAEAASESVADAMRQSKNVLMVDLRLPSYDITEGPDLYDSMAVYEFCSILSDKLRERGLIRKSLILVRNNKERAEIDRVRSQKDAQTTGYTGGKDLFGTAGKSTEGSEVEVDDFRQSLMASWDGINSEEGAIANSPQPASEMKIPENENSSHRLWSMVGDEEISSGPDMFDQVIAGVDANAILSAGEDALIILSPYDTADVIAIRRIMARYGQTRTIIIINSRMETLPRELDPAVLVYGVLPLIAMSKDDEKEAGVKVVAMKRFPAGWSVYVDVYGDGFVEARGSQRMIDASGKGLPSPQWIAQTVQAHIEGLSKQQ